MLRRAMVGLVAMASLLVSSVDTASANHHHGGYHVGQGHHQYGYGGGYGRGYGGYAYTPRVILPPPRVYLYPPLVGYGVQPSYGPNYSCPQPGFGLSTPGISLYIR